MTGLNKYSDKERRKMRIQNRIARDLRTPKYRQRKVELKTKKTDRWSYIDEDEEFERRHHNL
jgi:superfamily I DNA and/or RNA helicase